MTNAFKKEVREMRKITVGVRIESIDGEIVQAYGSADDVEFNPEYTRALISLRLDEGPRVTSVRQKKMFDVLFGMVNEAGDGMSKVE
ncbi:MAG: hypothetical protein BA863_10340 [Desulfovibrio sp. S3730MH75]|nr:MAG: hypothetical protein BA863_10340 [Desulfovibrio sp. S3730MH75]